MTFNDVFKMSFLEKVGSFSILEAVLALSIAFVLGLFIFVVYKKTYAGVMYSAGFGVSLIAMTMITSFVILAVTSNVVLSLGMVGALSIVRFRTAIKEPMDIAFLFWAIAAGIVLGAGLLPLAVIGTVLIGVIIFIFSNVKYNDTPYILVVSMTDDKPIDQVKKVIKSRTKKHLEKAATRHPQGVEITYEVRVKDDGDVVLSEIYAIDGVSNVTLVSYNGEYMS